MWSLWVIEFIILAINLISWQNNDSLFIANNSYSERRKIVLRPKTCVEWFNLSSVMKPESKNFEFNCLSCKTNITTT